MGTKFEHIQIRSKDKQDITPYLEEGDIVCQAARDWLAILPEGRDYKATPKRAKKLSKLLTGQIVVYTAYFDDDIFELSVYMTGSTKCAYRSNEQGKFVIKPAQWKHLFSLDTAAAYALRCLPQTGQTVAEDLAIIQAVLKTQLWLTEVSDVKQFNELDRENEAVIQTFNEIAKKLRSIDNQTKATLMKEQAGFLDRADIKEGQLIWRLITADEQGFYDIYHIHCYRLPETGEPEEFYSYRYPKEYYEPDCRYIHPEWRDSENIIVILNETDICVIEDYEVNGDEFEKLLYQEYIPLLTTKWKSPIEGYYEEHLPEGRAVVKKDKDGKVCASFLFPEHIKRVWLFRNGIIDTGNYIICFGEMHNDENIDMIIWVLNHELELIRQTVVPTKLRNYAFLADKTRQVIYMQDFGNKNISKYNIEEDRFETKFLGCGGYFLGMSPWGHLVLLESSSTVLFIDEELKIASRHRLKGRVGQIWISKTGDFYVLTADEYKYDLIQPTPPLKTYLYQITQSKYF